MLQRKAKAPVSFNEATREIDIVVSTETPVTRGQFDEVLSHDASAVDLSRFIGAPFLNAHKQGDARDVLGIVTRARIENGELVATVKLSRRADAEPIITDILDGIQRATSAGYAVQKWAESVDHRTGRRVRTATRWRPLEVSLIPIGADRNSFVRAEHRSPTMKKKQVGADPALDDDTLENEPVNENLATRNQSMRALCRDNGMTQKFCDDLIDGDGDLIAARAAVNEELQRRTPRIRTTVGVDHTDPAAIMQRQIGALDSRASGRAPKDDEREFAHLSIVEHADMALQRRGIATRGMRPEDRLMRSLNTGDLPEMLTGVGNRSLLSAYQIAAAPIVALAVKKTLNDFRPASFLRAGEFDEGLDLLTEDGEIKYTGRTESKESIQLDTYARGVNYTMRAMINDDLGALTDATAQFGQKAAAKDADVVLAVLNAAGGAGPTMDDGQALFSAAHDNLDPSNTPIGEDSVSAARLSMRSIVGLDGSTLLNIVPKFLVVSKELETAAEKFLAAFNPTTQADTNVFASRLTLMVEPRLPANEWQIWADPALAPVIALARLAGREAPQIEQQQAWTTWGVSFRCIHHVAAAAIGWRGAYKFANGEDSNSAVM